MNADKTPERIAALRAAMREQHVSVCLVPSADPHLSEYLPERWQARQWLSGFSGSAGTLLVSENFAALWTDSRYFEQAEQQLAGSGIQLMRLKVPHSTDYHQWLGEKLQSSDQLAVDGACLSLSMRRQLRAALADNAATLRTDLDLPGAVWPDRPGLPKAAVFEHDPAFAVTPRAEKLAAVRRGIRDAGASHHLLSSLDDIAWLTNLRGSDVDYNPVFLAHMLMDMQQATLFVETDKLETSLQRRLQDDGIRLLDYSEVNKVLAGLSGDVRLLLDPSRVVASLSDALDSHVTHIEQGNPSMLLKALKSTQQLAHIREAMRQDGAALVNVFHGLEKALQADHAVTELDVDRLLHEARAARDGFVGESFSTIAGYMANGALPHYRATPGQHAQLARDGLLLVDSGAQYLGGTTDITRMWAFGESTDEQRHDCSMVLKGMIALSRTHFPAGVSGPQLDALARAPLWTAGLDFGHGTGHGVGYFLNVHEGPHGIRPPAPGTALVPLEPGMITSVEPGVYKPGRYGIRHENLLVVIAVERTEFGQFLAFETLTLCPFDTRALEVELFDDAERAWLNTYHARVLEELLPLLNDADREWLQQRCAPL